MITRWSALAVARVGCVLALATSASAECAWMMWGSTPDGRFLPMLAYTTYAACEQESERITKNVAEGIRKGTTKPEFRLYAGLRNMKTIR